MTDCQAFYFFSKSKGENYPQLIHNVRNETRCNLLGERFETLELGVPRESGKIFDTLFTKNNRSYSTNKNEKISAHRIILYDVIPSLNATFWRYSRISSWLLFPLTL